jgi:hypothetical protein
VTFLTERLRNETLPHDEQDDHRNGDQDRQAHHLIWNRTDAQWIPLWQRRAYPGQVRLFWTKTIHK